MNRRVAVVGAGVGGLATAARLAHRGCEVDVYEKLAECGGRAHLIEDLGFKFDTGPSFVLMPDFFEEVFADCGEKIADYLTLRRLPVRYRIFYHDGRVLSFYDDLERTKGELEKFEPGAGRGFDDFVAETGRIYQATRPLLYRCLTARAIFRDPSFVKLALQIKVFSTYWKLAKRFFKRDDLCYALTFEAMFMGVSPFQAPAFYSIISYADHVQKIFHPMGGMYEIPRALERMARKFGARFHYNAPVKYVHQEGDGFLLRGDRLEFNADRAVINADLAYAQSELLGRRLRKYQYSCSVYLLYLGMKTKVKGLDHHNIFFPRDINRNLEAVFGGGTVTDDPSFYIHVPTVTDPSLAPAGKDIVYVLVPVANLEKTKFDGLAHEEALRAAVFARVRESVGVDLKDLIEVEHRFYPSDFIRRYNIANAATFGLAHNLAQSAFLRPANADPACPGLYFVGASTQPGGGLPPVLASSRIVADLLTGEGS